MKVTVDVRNTGKVAGDEVVQLYVRDVVSSVTRPVKELKGFQARHARARRDDDRRVHARPEALALWDEDMKRVVEPGEFHDHGGPELRRPQELPC